MISFLRVVLACTALAMAGAPPGRAASEPPSEATLLKQNPDLARLAKADPERYRQARAIIDAAKDKPPSGGRGASTPPLDKKSRDLVARNPALEQVMNASPEAMHDLLQLLRQASSKGSGQVKN